jgi:hypothetical protein
LQSLKPPVDANPYLGNMWIGPEESMQWGAAVVQRKTDEKINEKRKDLGFAPQPRRNLSKTQSLHFFVR